MNVGHEWHSKGDQNHQNQERKKERYATVAAGDGGNNHHGNVDDVMSSNWRMPPEYSFNLNRIQSLGCWP